jgi:hypothetical protein
MKDIHITIKAVDLIRIPCMFIVMVILMCTGWKFLNWQYWIVALSLAAVFIGSEKKYGKRKK